MARFSVTLAVLGCLLFASFSNAGTIRELESVLEVMRGDREIIGGGDAEKGEFPWQVAFKYVKDNQIFCGGSIIDKFWILTAAHCVVDLPDDFIIVAGDYSLKNDDGTEQTRMPDQIYKHEEYDKEGNSENDIAVIKMDLPLELNDNVNVVAIPDEPTNNGTLCTISGWGARSDSIFDPDFPDILQKVNVPTVTDEVCQDGCEGLRCVIEETMMCAGYFNGGRDSCQGDSGGPLVCEDSEGNVYQAGVVSTGYGCALAELYGIYTELWYYKDWIRTTQYGPTTDFPFPSGSNKSAVLSLSVALVAFLRILML